MSDNSYDYDDYFDDEIRDDCQLCPRCDGHQIVSCHCGGDLCFCDNHGEAPCPLCGGEYGGEGYVKNEVAERYLKKQREFMEALSKGLGDGK